MLNTVLRIVEFILALGVLAFFHELGHYLTARLFNIEVEEFGLGFPLPGVPSLKLFTFKGTLFTLNWIPFGAFVRPKGENDPAIAGGLAAAKPFPRILVLIGGPLMNLLIGILLFSLVFVQTGSPDVQRVSLSSIAAESPAAQVGLSAGDIILEVNGQKIDSMERLSSIVQDNLGKEVTLLVDRNGQQQEFKLTPRKDPPPNEGSMGIIMSNPVIKINWFEAVPLAFETTYEQAKQLVLLPGKLIAGQIDPAQARVVGPKGMYDIYSQVRDMDQQAESGQEGTTATPHVFTLSLVAIISVALGLTNLLPLPALDGGRILFVLPELLIRKRVPAQFENMVHFIGFAALILFIFVVTIQDIINPVKLP